MTVAEADIADALAAQPDVSVLIPTLNEAPNVAAIAKAVISELEQARVSFELLFIDNGSSDATVSILRGLCARDRRIRAIVNNRNYGQMRSPTYGIYQASGRAVLAMCADFQDPPELLGEMIARWRAGSQIVLGVRISEPSAPGQALARWLGYGFLARFADYRVIPGATGFGIYDRAVVDCLSKWNEPEPFFRGMLVESGFSLETIPYHRPRRSAGRSKNNLFTGLSFALSALASSSKALLRTPLFVSVAMFAVSLLLLLAGGARAVWRGSSGGLVIAGLVELEIAALFFFLGLFGEQIRLISERTRNTPLVIEKERINFPTAIDG